MWKSLNIQERVYPCNKKPQSMRCERKISTDSTGEELSKSIVLCWFLIA